MEAAAWPITELHLLAGQGHGGARGGARRTPAQQDQPAFAAAGTTRYSTRARPAPRLAFAVMAPVAISIECDDVKISINMDMNTKLCDLGNAIYALDE